MGGEVAWPARDGPLVIVTGAPGAGKSVTVAALLRRKPDYLVFDADWLLPDLSALVGRAIADEAALWPPYRRLWLTIARMVGWNGRGVALFIPIEPGELADVLPADRNGAVRWYLLDCDDAVRRARLAARGWSDAAVDQALADARGLRAQIAQVIDTGRVDGDSVAAELDRWMLGGDTHPGLRVPREGARADVL